MKREGDKCTSEVISCEYTDRKRASKIEKMKEWGDIVNHQAMGFNKSHWTNSKHKEWMREAVRVGERKER